jgi:hypothetical protein
MCAIGRWTDLHVGQRRQAPPIARDKLDAWRRVPPSSDRCVVSALRRGSHVLVNVRFASRVISTRSIAWKTPRCVRTSLVHHDGGMPPNQIPAAERCQQRSHARATANFEESSSARPGRPGSAVILGVSRGLSTIDAIARGSRPRPLSESTSTIARIRLAGHGVVINLTSSGPVGTCPVGTLSIRGIVSPDSSSGRTRTPNRWAATITARKA